MADFVAVIRRAVDSLPTNTPDMRVRVYDKARGAVRRQLENMKPAPPEDMLRRQMEKLEAAILSVEAEHAEALPAEEAAFAGTAPTFIEEPETLPAEEPVHEARSETPADAWATEEPPQADEAGSPQAEPPAGHDDEMPAEDVQDPYRDHHPVHEDVPDPQSERIGIWPQEAEEPAVEPVHHAPFDATDNVDPAADPMDEDLPYPVRGPVTPIVAAASEPEWQRVDVPPPAGQAAPDDWNWPSQEPSPEDAETGWDEAPAAAPLAAEGFPAPAEHGSEAHFEQENRVAADSVRMPSVSDFPELAAGSAAVAGAQHAAGRGPESDPWNDLEDLIGYNRNAVPADEAAGLETAGEPEIAQAPRAYRVAPKKRNYTGAILAVIGMLILAGGGYALWLNRDSLTDVVGGVLETPVAEENGSDGEPVETAAPNEPAETTTPPAGAEATTAAPDATGDGVAESSKFTQRLLADGTEVDEGPGAEGPSGAGQSVAELNAPPAASGGAATPPAQSGSSGEPTANPADAAALSGEKMFLYEERLGQTAPTAIEGAVSWSLQREAGVDNAREPVVQGRINIPDRGLTALITFKRNTDASLPASHLVEIVFAVPPDFEGGAVDSVQRIAMKQTEQDRGDALIAVPAKITDDFHMIALNDFPDARATNLELMRSRGWMDIPLAYRNGRRALLTLQKGQAGNEAFNEAIREWSALAGSATPGNAGSGNAASGNAASGNATPGTAPSPGQ